MVVVGLRVELFKLYNYLFQIDPSYSEHLTMLFTTPVCFNKANFFGIPVLDGDV